MNDDFPNWLSGLKVKLEGATVEARWNAVDEVATSATTDTVSALLALVFELPKVKADAKEVGAFLARIKAYDDSFLGHGADVEIRLLAAATVVAIMSRNGALAAWAAMAVITSHFDGLRQTPQNLPVPIQQIARDRLGELAEQSSARPSSQPVKITVPKVATAPEPFDAATVTKMVNTAVNQVMAQVSVIVDHHNNAIANFSRYLSIQDEELQILWWVVGQRCRTLDVPFDELKIEQQPLVLGGELSQLVEQLPGPPSLKAILSRAGLRDAAKVSLASALNACPADWIERNAVNVESSLVFPIHFAINRKAEVDADEWAAPFKSMTGIDATAPLSVLVLANQYMFEDMLLRLGA
ncbi:hypothetical protein FHL81_19930 [Agrobacterium tumefaciens]|uniref:GTPase-associated system all-helical protein GASH n=1 Tax=Agrobacterium tumefaciens TaxID=358 RepID=UPI0012562A63|nr:GTPase-associated system all-helical protein GASH [Agrobacterium tumefaciens]KAA1233654.1 hypothetical protein FHL81_19930 [Agrobacterium tumefaciens]